MHKAAPRGSAASRKTIWRFIIGLMNRRRSSLIFAIVDFGIMPKGFSCANDYLVFRSSIAKARKSPCDTLENSTSRRIWDESQQLKTGSRESSQNAGCTDSDCKRKANRLPAAIHSIRIVERFAQVRPFSL